jgi:two-component system sensor histidine kinase BarA
MRDIKLRYLVTLPAIAVVIVVMTIAVNVAVNSRSHEVQVQMIEKSRDLALAMRASWEFVSNSQDIINYDVDGTYDFKGIHCAVAGTGIGKLFSAESECTVQYASLNPRNPQNAADAFEQQAVAAFENDCELEEYYLIDEMDGQRTFRYAIPLRAETECMDCHGGPKGEMDVTGYPKEGISQGDLIGVMTVDQPTHDYDKTARGNAWYDIWFTGFLLLLSVLAMWFALSRYVTRPLERLEDATEEIANNNFDTQVDPVHIRARGEIAKLVRRFNQMALNLKASYGAVEEQVRTRTRELSEANKKLTEHQAEVEALNEQLQADSNYKSEFLATMSHELKTPLTSMMANMNVLKKQHAGEDDETDAVFGDIERNSEMLLNLINQILDAARLDAGKMTLSLEAVDMVDIVNAVEPAVLPIAQQRGIEYEVSFDNDIPIIEADSDKLVKIIMNLVGNALKFTDHGGHVHLALAYIQAENNLVITVEDDGMGLKGDDVERIFEKFYQSDQSISRTHGGTGLGLSLVKEFAQMHGGDARAESLDGGSRFTVRIIAQPWVKDEE